MREKEKKSFKIKEYIWDIAMIMFIVIMIILTFLFFLPNKNENNISDYDFSNNIKQVFSDSNINTNIEQRIDETTYHLIDDTLEWFTLNQNKLSFYSEPYNYNFTTLRDFVTNKTNLAGTKTLVFTPNDDTLFLLGKVDNSTNKVTLLNGLNIDYNYNHVYIKSLIIKGNGATYIDNNNVETDLTLTQTTDVMFFSIDKLTYQNGVDVGWGEGYDEGLDEGYNEGYIEGLDEGLKSVFDNNNRLPGSLKMGKNTTAPDNRFFGYRITLPEPIYINNIDIIGLEKYHELLDLDVMSSSANVLQGVVLGVGNAGYINLAFKNFTDSVNYELITSVKNNQEILIDTITIALAISNPSMNQYDFERLQDEIYNNVGVYINNMILSNNAMEHYFNYYYTEGYYDAIDEQTNLIEQAYAKGKIEGYDEGLVANPDNNMLNMIRTVLLGVGTVLGIELLPNITIGAIILIPIVFGLIAFVLGRKKD